MKFTKTSIPDVVFIEPSVFSDSRGVFFESFRKDIFAKHGITHDFVQDNHSTSKQGTLRGLHYQIEPKAQAKLVRVVVGEIFDVAVDIRQGSKTFGQWVGMVLSAANRHMLFIPEGFAHGFCTLSESADVLYKASDFYSPEHERGILWSDPTLAIDWPKVPGGYILSEKDKQFPALEEASGLFFGHADEGHTERKVRKP